MTQRRKLVIALGLAAFTAPLSSFAQQSADKVRRIGFLAISGPIALGSSSYAAFVEGMQELGWVEGKNLLIEWRYADGDYSRLPRLAAELVQIRVEVIVTHATPGTQAARQATGDIPIVTAAVADAVGSGFAATLARPGGNITGLTNMGIDMAMKQLEILTIMMPKLSTVAFLLNPGTAPVLAVFESLRAASGRFRVKILRFDARTPQDIDAAFATMTMQHVEAVIVANEAFLVGEGRHIAELGIKHRMPTMFSYRDPVVAGGLLSYGESLFDVWKQTAGYVDKILKGSKPGDMPFEQPRKIQLTFNRKTAKALGITIPQEMLMHADEVIE